MHNTKFFKGFSPHTHPLPSLSKYRALKLKYFTFLKMALVRGFIFSLTRLLVSLNSLFLLLFLREILYTILSIYYNSILIVRLICTYARVYENLF